MSTHSPSATPLPRWVDVLVIPALNLLMALLAVSAVMLFIGQNPAKALPALLQGAAGSGTSLGYTLYYATSFAFAGLAVALAFHAGLFNVGAEGQATLGGLGLGVCVLALDTALPGFIVLPIAVAAGAAFGAAWAFIPAWLQVHRGSHIVITTIMFNLLASALMVWLLVNHLQKPNSLQVESRAFHGVALPQAHEVAQWLGMNWPQTPLNMSALLAVALLLVAWLALWHTRWGFAVRATGHAPLAAGAAGLRPARVVVIAMCLSGACAAMIGVNEIAGVHKKLLLDFVSGAGYTGIAVALMGRNHPLGIALAALLFGALHQGGSELAFEMPSFTRDMVIVIQGFVILFSGSLALMLKRPLERLFAGRPRPDANAQETTHG